MILIDTSVLVDLFADDSTWQEPSLAALEEAAAREPLAINDIVYAELCPGFDDTDSLDNALTRAGVRRVEIPKQALFLAGHAYRQYRRQRGTKTGVLPDFFIGAHALVTGAPLLTRDARRIARYFPAVTLLSP